MWKLRAGLLLVTLTVLAACSSTQTQTGLSLGDRIRITPSDPAEERFGGSYQDAREESLVVVGEGDTITIPISQIATLERQEGTRGRTGPGAFIGLLGGAAIGVGVARGGECEGSSAGDTELEGLCRVVVIGMGVLGGTALGALVGSFIRTENWVVVPLVEVAPSGGIATGRGVSFGLRLARSRRPR